MRGGFAVASPKSSSMTSDVTVTFAGATLHVDAAKLGEEAGGQRLRRTRPPLATRQREGSCCSSSSSLAFLAAAPAGFAAVPLALAGLRSTSGAAPLCAPAVVMGAFSMERRGRERKRSAGAEEEEGAVSAAAAAAEEAEDGEAAAEEEEGGEGGGATSLLELAGAFSTEKTVAPLGVAAPGTLQADTGVD